MTTEFKMPEPVYQRKPPSGFWLDYSKRAVYTSSDMRAVIEQCAKLATCAGAGSAEVAGLDVQDYIAEEIRKLLEQVK